MCIILHTSTNMEEFFQKLGLDSKESKILLSVIKLGAQPASVIAQHVQMDRTTVYRLLKKLYGQRLLAKSNRKGVTVFYLEKLSDIEHYIQKERDRFENLNTEFHTLLPRFSAMQSTLQALPHIQIYDGFEKLQDFYRDIIARTKEQNLLQIRILGSNTFSQKLEQHKLGELIANFQKDLKNF